MDLVLPSVLGSIFFISHEIGETTRKDIKVRVDQHNKKNFSFGNKNPGLGLLARALAHLRNMKL